MAHLYPVPDTGAGQGSRASAPNAIASEVPDALSKLTPKEKKVWVYITQALKDCGLVHRTDAVTLTVICRTFVRWLDVEEELSEFVKKNNGSYIVKTSTGYEQPHQLIYLVRTLKKELLQWLPEAALTIPSFQKATGAGAAPEQGSLFGDDPVESHRRRKTAIGMSVV